VSSVEVEDIGDATPFMKGLLTGTDDAAEARTAIQALRYLKPARSFESNGTDDTATAQALLAEGAGEYIVRKGTNLVIDANTTTGMLEPQSNTRIFIEEGATVRVKTNALSEYHLFHLDGVENVTIEGGGTLQGDALVHTGTTGQYGHLIYITNGSSDIRVVGPLRGKEAWGDFIYIGGGLTAVNHDILIDGVIADDCRREAFSPFWVDGCTIRDYRINGGPAALIEAVLGNGIDVEPNDGQWVTDLTIERGYIEGLIGNGIYASPLPAGGTAPYIRNLKIERPIVVGCGQDPTVPGHGNNIYIKNTDDLLLIDPYTEDAGTVGDALACNIKLSGITGAKLNLGTANASSGEGLQVSLCPDLDVFGFSARNNRKRGANIDQSNKARIRACEFTDNVLDNTAGSGHLRFTNSDETLAELNTFEGTLGGAWISYDASCTDNYYENNQGVGASPAAKVLDAGASNVGNNNTRKDTGHFEFWTDADKQHIAPAVVDLAVKATPIDADNVMLVDTEDANKGKRTPLSNIKIKVAAWLSDLISGTVVAIHNQTDRVTNFERLRLFFSSNVAQLMSEQGGTGTFRDLRVGVANTHYTGYSISNPKVHHVAAATGTAGAVQQSTQSGLTGASVAQTGHRFAPTINQTGTSSYIGVEVAVTETATGSGTKKPFAVSVGASEKFAVDNAGVARVNSTSPLINRNVATVTTTVTIGAVAGVDYVVFIGASGAPTLPTAVSNTNRYSFKNIDSVDRTISTTSAQTIDGSATLVLPAGAAVDLISDGANWRVF
jgi:hypothetical protein